MALREREINDNNMAICYYRYSSKGQNDASIEQQQEAAQRYAEAHGLQIIKEYEDRAKTGTNDNRPGFQAMLAEIGQLKPHALIVWKTDRIGRNRYDLVVNKKLIHDAGCRIMYVAESIPDDSPEAAIIEALFEAMAENYSRNLRSNVIRGQMYNVEHGIYNGRTVLGYIGRKGEKYQIDPDTAPLVKRIYEEYAKGKQMTDIMNDLNNAGHRSRRNKPFTVNSIRRILHNRTYLGEYHWADLVIPDAIPRIISDELFAEVQDRMQKNKRKAKAKAMALSHGDDTEDFWLTGTLYCGKCGSSMHGYSGYGKKKKIYYYYTCHNHIAGSCKKKNVRKKDIEDIVEQTMRETLEDPIQVGAIALWCARYLELKSAEKGYLESLKARMKDTTSKIQNIVDVVAAGHSNEELLKRLDDLESQKKMLKESIDAEEARKRMTTISMDDIVKLLQQYSNGTYNNAKVRDALLNVLIEKIYLYDDRIDIYVLLGYKKVKHTISLEEREKTIADAEDFYDLGFECSAPCPIEKL